MAAPVEVVITNKQGETKRFTSQTGASTGNLKQLIVSLKEIQVETNAYLTELVDQEKSLSTKPTLPSDADDDEDLDGEEDEDTDDRGVNNANEPAQKKLKT